MEAKMISKYRADNYCINCGKYNANEDYIFPLCDDCVGSFKNGIYGNFTEYSGKSQSVKSFELILERKDIILSGDILMLPIPENDEDSDKVLSVCPICERKFYKSNGQYTCGQCFYVNKCETCGDKFLSKDKKQRFCSKKCSSNKEIEPMITIRKDSIFSKKLEELVMINLDNCKLFNYPGIIVNEDGEIIATENISSESEIILRTSISGKKIYFWSKARSFGELILQSILCIYSVSPNLIKTITSENIEIAFRYLTKNSSIIIWQLIQEGNRFMDGSEVIHKFKSEIRKSYRVTISSGSIIMADNHLIEAEIMAESGELINDDLVVSERARLAVGEDDSKWVCADDLFSCYSTPGIKISINGESPIIEYVGELPVMCVETDTHNYKIFDINNHNCARYLYYGLSDTYIMEDDCSNDKSTGILTCTAPGGFCEKCAKKAGMGKVLGQLKKEQKGKGVGSIKIGGLVSTNLSEPLTQLYLDSIHSASSDTSAVSHTHIVGTYEGYASSPVIKDAAQYGTTAERRQALYKGLKNLYESNDVAIDDWNLQVVAKKMTSYKRTKQGLKLINEDKGELCDIVSIRNIGGNTSGNVFKNATFSSAYETLSKGGKMNINEADSFNDIFREEF